MTPTQAIDIINNKFLDGYKIMAYSGQTISIDLFEDEKEALTVAIEALKPPKTKGKAFKSWIFKSDKE